MPTPARDVLKSLFEYSQGLTAAAPPLLGRQSSAAHAVEGAGPTAMLQLPGAPPQTRFRIAGSGCEGQIMTLREVGCNRAAQI
ncbi:MAG: hypothetical protein ACP5P4_05445 [Steroidobacteraceae bacterium]